MLANKKHTSIIKHTIVYVITTVLQKGIIFILLPLNTALLSPEEFGIQSTVLAISQFLSVLFTLALDSAIIRYFFECRSDPERQKKIVGSAVLLLVILNVSALCLLTLLQSVILAPFIKGITFFPYVFIGLIYAFFLPIFSIYQSILRISEKSGKYALSALSYVILYTVLNVVLVKYMELGALGLLGANAISAVVFFFISILGMRKIMRWTLEQQSLKALLSYSLPILPHSLSNWINQMLDRVIIANLKSLYDVGIYNVGAQFGLILNTLTLSFNMAYTPWLFKKIESGKENKSIILVSNIAAFIYCMIAEFITLFGKEILGIFIDPKYLGAILTLPLFLFGYVFWGYYMLFVNILFYEKKYSRMIPVATLSGALLNVALCLLLIPPLGIVGAALAGFVTKLIVSIGVLALSKKAYNVKFQWLRMYATALVMFGATQWLNMTDSSVFIRSLAFLISFIACLTIFARNVRSVLSLIGEMFRRRAA